MIQWRHAQLRLCDQFWSAEVSDLWPPWMREADRLLDDEALIERVFEAQGKRRKQSKSRGRKQTPAEVVLRLLILKHTLNCSFEVLEREVRANVVYRNFTRVGMEKVPDAKVLAKIALLIGPEVVAGLHRRIVELAQGERLVRGRRMRVDTTVVETNIHYPTDSSLLGDGARVLTRLMKKVEEQAGGLVGRVRNRMRSVGKKVVAIAVSSRRKGPEGEEQRKKHYRVLLQLTRKVMNQARRVCTEVSGLPVRRKAALKPLLKEIQTTVGRVKQVIRQTKTRVFGGNAKMPDKLVSLFEPHSEIIRKGKASKPTEFGKMVKIQEAENQVIVDYEVFAERPSDSDLLVESVGRHQQRLGVTPFLVAADAGFYSAANEKKLTELGVKRISVPSRNTKSEVRKKKQKEKWFKRGQRWRTGCEGRISVLKRRHGLNRSRYRGQQGIERWVGLRVIADNLISMGRLLAARGAEV